MRIVTKNKTKQNKKHDYIKIQKPLIIRQNPKYWSVCVALILTRAESTRLLAFCINIGSVTEDQITLATLGRYCILAV